ncbi:MAG: thioredoxin [Candidatus Shapirobacteria bacterium]|nr:thioredoxin [Candidatus Shapirobacteria bacterium]
MNDFSQTTGLILVDFSATWCGPCQMLAPIIEEIGQERKDIKIVKIDVDANPEIANQYNVTSIPTVIIFENGQIKNTIIGFHQKQEYLSAL